MSVNKEELYKKLSVVAIDMNEDEAVKFSVEIVSEEYDAAIEKEL